MAMRVTVAIPCYNGARYVARAIESVLKQTRPPDEILVVDDGSTDDSAAIIRRYPVRLVQHERNLGLSNARNTAIEQATGDVLVYVDVDAMADRSLVETLLGSYDAPDVAGVGGQGIESNVHSIADRWRVAHATQSHGARAREVWFLYGLCMSWRLDCLREVGGFDASLRTNGEDVDMGLRMRAAGYRMRYLPAARVYHQRTDDVASLTRTMVAWCVAAYVVRRRNRAQPWRSFVRTAYRLTFDPLSDLIVRRDLALAVLSWRITRAKLRGLWRAAREVRG
ncbi:MAG: glycosyltransferase [Anaerolineae bacterium]|nr:glycosyltransferase [Anaerolineae bacterium]